MGGCWCVGRGTRERGGGRACLRIVGMGGYPVQGKSFEAAGFPLVVALWNKGAPAVTGAWRSGTPIIYVGYV